MKRGIIAFAALATLASQLAMAQAPPDGPRFRPPSIQGQGKVRQKAAAPRPVAPKDVQALRLNPGELLELQTGLAAERESPKKARWDLPFQFSLVQEDGKERTSRLFAEMTSGGLWPSPDSQAFVGDLMVGLKDLQDPTAQYNLPAGVPATIIIAAPPNVVEKNQLDLDRVGKAQLVKMSWASPTPEFKVTISSLHSAQPVELAVKVWYPSLEVMVSPTSILGFGLGVTTVSVRAQDLPESVEREVTLVSDYGQLKDFTVKLTGSAPTKTELRSEGLESTRVKASGPQLNEAASSEVHFASPWPFLGAAVFGGVVGAFIKRQQARRKGGQSKKLQAALLLGACTGLLIAALYAVGLNLLPVQFSATSGEALVFGVAGLGGFVGLRVPVAREAA
jgi:hypothetical protein